MNFNIKFQHISRLLLQINSGTIVGDVKYCADKWVYQQSLTFVVINIVSVSSNNHNWSHTKSAISTVGSKSALPSVCYVSQSLSMLTHLGSKIGKNCAMYMFIT